MIKKELQKFKFIKKEGGLERALISNVDYGPLEIHPMEVPSGWAYLDCNYTADVIQSQVNQTVTFNSTERVLEFWDDSTFELIKIPLDRLIS